MRVKEATRYLASGLCVYVVMAACSDDVFNRPRDRADAAREDASRGTDEAGRPRRDSGPLVSEGGRLEGGRLEGGLLDRFIDPVTDAVAQQACATCSGGAFRVITAETDPAQRVRGTVSVAATGVAAVSEDGFATSKVVDGPLFLTDADSIPIVGNVGFIYYVVLKSETCGPTPGAPDDSSGTTATTTTFPGQPITITRDALRNAKAFILADEKLCVRQLAFSASTSLPAATRSWSGYRPYGDG